MSVEKYVVLLLKDGKYFGSDTPETEPDRASILENREVAAKWEAEIRAGTRKPRKAVSSPLVDHDPIVPLDVARRLYAIEYEAARKPDPYAVAAVDKGRQMESKMGELVGQLQAAVQGRLSAEASAHRLTVERDDLARKLRKR